LLFRSVGNLGRELLSPGHAGGIIVPALLAAVKADLRRRFERAECHGLFSSSSFARLK
jgi:hypothetical protein